MIPSVLNRAGWFTRQFLNKLPRATNHLGVNNMLTVGDIFPPFNLLSVNGTDLKTAFERMTIPGLRRRALPSEISYVDWLVFVAWPKDFTFICPTEILEFNKVVSEFAARNAQLIGLSTDSEFVHLAWRQSRADLGAVTFPWLADNQHLLSKALGILHPVHGVCSRATFIIDRSNVIRHVSVNDLDQGRNPAEVLRVLDALQEGGLCPCNWQAGEDTLHPGEPEPVKTERLIPNPGTHVPPIDLQGPYVVDTDNHTSEWREPPLGALDPDLLPPETNPQSSADEALELLEREVQNFYDDPKYGHGGSWTAAGDLPMMQVREEI